MSQYLQQQPIKEYNNTTMSRAVAFSFLISNGESITLASEIIRQISSKLADGSSLETLVTSCTEVNANYLQLICYLNALTHQKLDPVKIWKKKRKKKGFWMNSRNKNALLTLKGINNHTWFTPLKRMLTTKNLTLRNF